MSIQSGYLLIADITGYTGYLTRSELEHANPIIHSLLEAIVMELKDPMKLRGLEGDAVLAYSSGPFPSGETFLNICESLYRVFAERRRNIVQNTTCPCNACRNVADLDLKVLAHHGKFEELSIGPMKDISGADVVLVHRMAKTNVKEDTGILSYALFSEDAFQAMGIESELMQYSAQFEHFGDVPMRVYDLAAAWQRYREIAEPVRVTDKEAVFTTRHILNAPPVVAWEMITDPRLKMRWMMLIDAYREGDASRTSAGVRLHCIHEAAHFQMLIVDWHPFEYVTDILHNSSIEGLTNLETYELAPVIGGTEIVFRMGRLTDADGIHHPNEEAAVIELFKDFYPVAFGILDELALESRQKKQEL